MANIASTITILFKRPLGPDLYKKAQADAYASFIITQLFD